MLFIINIYKNIVFHNVIHNIYLFVFRNIIIYYVMTIVTLIFIHCTRIITSLF